MNVSTDPMITKYPIAHHEFTGIELMFTPVPVAPIIAKVMKLEISICNPKLKYGLKLAAFFLVYIVPKAQLTVAIKERKIPNLKSGLKKSAR